LNYRTTDKLEYARQARKDENQGREPTTISTRISGIEPGLHWWEASALITTAPSLHVYQKGYSKERIQNQGSKLWKMTLNET